MAKMKFDSPEEKKRLQERALALKPRVAGVVVTDQGWAVARPKGTMEILVSFKNLDELLGDAVSEVELVGEPIVIVPEVVTEEVKVEEAIVIVPEVVTEEVKVEEDIVMTEEVKVEEVKEEPKVDLVKPSKAKPGPKKKAK
jgi:hypothetical protein